MQRCPSHCVRLRVKSVSDERCQCIRVRAKASVFVVRARPKASVFVGGRTRLCAEHWNYYLVDELLGVFGIVLDKLKQILIFTCNHELFVRACVRACVCVCVFLRLVYGDIQSETWFLV